MSRLRRRALFALATTPAFEAAVRAVPGGEARAWRSARRYVADDPIATARELHAAGLRASVDLFGERVGDDAVPGVVGRYAELCARIAEVPDAWVSLDLSHVALDPFALREIAAAVPAGRRLQVGAEEAEVADRVLGAVLANHAAGLPVEATLQANLRRSPGDAERLADAGVPVRLVKGAYVERDALPWGPQTDAAYVALAHRLHAGGAGLALATHDAPLRDQLIADLPGARCELLLGVRPGDALALAAAGRDVRVYVPYGEQWFRYFMRRRAEAQGA
jgi:proline dehydrogenase